MKVRPLLVLSCVLSVVTSGQSQGSEPAQKRLVPRNVELTQDLELHFAVVNEVGRPVAEESVIVVANEQAYRVTPDQQGRYRFQVAKPGVIVVLTSDFTYGCRVWNPGTAPPGAQKSIAFVHGQDAVVKVRGQLLGSALRATNRLYGLAILGLGGVALWQALDRDDAS